MTVWCGVVWCGVVWCGVVYQITFGEQGGAADEGEVPSNPQQEHPDHIVPISGTEYHGNIGADEEKHPDEVDGDGAHPLDEKSYDQTRRKHAHTMHL